MSRKNESPPITQQDIVIAVMGATGAGKSSFIKLATGNSPVTIGHKLRSCTQTVQPVRSGNVVFLDTPGFDDTKMTDSEVLVSIASWLTTTYKQGIKLTGLLFLHRISDNRMTATASRNTDMFKLVCGANALQNVILVTTMWSEVDEKTGSSREEELQNDFWKTMIDSGSKMMRFLYSYESAWDILAQFSGIRRSLLLQEEMVDNGKLLSQTSAGSALFEWLTQVIAQVRDLINKLQALLSGASKGSKPAQEYQEKLLATQQKLKLAIEQKNRVTPVPRTFADVVKTVMASPTFRDRTLSASSITTSPTSSPTVEGCSRGMAATRTILRHGVAVVEMSELPFLKGAVALSLTIMEAIEAMKRNEQSLVTLAKGIRLFCSVIDEHKPTGDTLGVMTHALEALYKELIKVKAILSKLSSHGRIRQYVLQPDDERILGGCTQRITDAYNIFMMRSVISIQKEIRNLRDDIRNDGEAPKTCPKTDGDALSLAPNQSDVTRKHLPSPLRTPVPRMDLLGRSTLPTSISLTARNTL